MKLRDAVSKKKRGTIRKFEHYFPIYDSFFEKIQEQALSLLEIGVGWGGSLYTWAEYFPNSRITGIDSRTKRKEFENQQIKIFIGDQADPDFLKSVNDQRGPFDVVIDDGGHMMHQQTTSLEALFPLLKDGGYYIIEDWQTSFLPKYQDGSRRTIDLLKDLVDGLTLPTVGRVPGQLAQNMVSLHFHNSIVIIQKGENKAGQIVCL